MYSSSHHNPLPNFSWGTSEGWKRGCGSGSEKEEPPSCAKLGSPFPAGKHVVGNPHPQFILVFKDSRFSGGEEKWGVR